MTDRNGFRPRLIATQAGDIELRIPKLRTGSFFPAILAPRRRIDQALFAGGDGGLRQRRVHPRGRRPGRRARRRIRHFEVGGVPDLRRPRRAGRGIPQPTPRCFRVRKKPRQNTSSSESPTSTPNASRPPGGGHSGRDQDGHQVSPRAWYQGEQVADEVDPAAPTPDRFQPYLVVRDDCR